MQIIPVIDIMDGKAVSGKSGEREKYTDLKTVFAESSDDPIEIAENIPSKRLYVADLDGITKGMPNFDLLKRLSEIKRLMVDIGIRDYTDLEKISQLNVDIIIGTETLEGIETLEKAIKKFNKKIIVSIDVKNGKVISQFLPKNPKSAFEFLKDKNVKRFIFLDLSSVGTLSGFKLAFLGDLELKEVEVYVGGGVKNEDIKKLKKIGVSGALVGTALHRGLFKL
jgi:phosphoribosylformimino-5-aminoimidazole carboxamide ribotide isomerase